jgi:hypothetical protein
MTQVDATSEEDRRQQAIKRIKAKRDFRVHLLVYVLVNSASSSFGPLLVQGERDPKPSSGRSSQCSAGDSR